jgi:hypothetical protein
MTAASDSKKIVLSGEEAAYVRNVLAICSQALARAHDHASPIAGALLAEAVAAVADGKGVNSLIYEVNLAIDYLDFAPGARSWR